MYLALTDEQRLLREAAADALGRHDTLGAARAALDGEPAPDLWGTAIEAGWTGLLAGEDVDGAGLSAYDAMLVLEVCGGGLADARLLGHLAATALLEQAGADEALRAALAVGERRAALVDATTETRSAPLSTEVRGDEIVIDGSVRSTLDAAGADTLVIAGVDGNGAPAAAVVETGAEGLRIASGAAYDATRSLARVEFEGVVGNALRIEPERVADGALLQRALLAAESIGAADACLTMARDYAVDRVAFGRAIGSYQAIKHKLVEMLRRIEGARSLVVYAGRCWDADRPRFALAANAARVIGGDALTYSAPECIFIHGGVGATWEHDASLYYRRAELSRRLVGGVDAAAQAVAELLIADGVPDAAEELVLVGASNRGDV